MQWNEMKSTHAEVSFWQGWVWFSEMSCILWPTVGTAAFNLNKIFLARATLFRSLLTCNQWDVAVDMSVLTFLNWYVTLDVLSLACPSLCITLKMSHWMCHSWYVTLGMSPMQWCVKYCFCLFQVELFTFQSWQATSTLFVTFCPLA